MRSKYANGLLVDPIGYVLRLGCLVDSCDDFIISEVHHFAVKLSRLFRGKYYGLGYTLDGDSNWSFVDFRAPQHEVSEVSIPTNTESYSVDIEYYDMLDRCIVPNPSMAARQYIQDYGAYNVQNKKSVAAAKDVLIRHFMNPSSTLSEAYIPYEYLDDGEVLPGGTIKCHVQYNFLRFDALKVNDERFGHIYDELIAKTPSIADKRIVDINMCIPRAILSDDEERDIVADFQRFMFEFSRRYEEAMSCLRMDSVFEYSTIFYPPIGGKMPMLIREGWLLKPTWSACLSRAQAQKFILATKDADTESCFAKVSDLPNGGIYYQLSDDISICDGNRFVYADSLFRPYYYHRYMYDVNCMHVGRKSRGAPLARSFRWVLRPEDFIDSNCTRTYFEIIT